ncbi:HAMP domain-containing protein [Thiorhodococcus minor]|uniref:histidine kinase n=1 Tax=Thiorhodococcus minor TaxID=57489 RepID=A0A6M0JU67_9GAMM|nr:HAMP domain-containing protein [Thiorhodococcus minor]
MPASLFGRLTLVLLVGLVAAQLLSATILLRDRGQTLYQSIQRGFVERTVGIVRLLDVLTPRERARLLPLFHTPESRVRLAEEPSETAPGQGVAEAAAERLRRQLSGRLPPDTELRVVLDNDLRFLTRRRGRDHRPPPPDHPPGMGPEPRPWSALARGRPMARGFFIQIRLTDGTWVQFVRAVPEDVFERPARLLLTLGILLVSVILLALLAVRWLVGPLRTLRSAAEALGRDIRRPPIPERGPLEVAQTAHAFNTMQQRLQRFIDDRARILAAVSHDLKTPLTRMRLRTDLLDDAELRAKLQRDLDDMESMVKATLDFMQGSDSREATQTLDLNALLETIQSDAQDAGWTVSLTGSADAPIQARPKALKRCITNLVENAARYGGGAEIGVEERPGALVILVRDRGPGVPQPLLEQVFEPFFRLEASRARHSGGTGLGLGIARNIARGHGGDLLLRNRVDGGLCAELTLPQ